MFHCYNLDHQSWMDATGIGSTVFTLAEILAEGGDLRVPRLAELDDKSFFGFKPKGSSPEKISSSNSKKISTLE